MEAQYIGYEFDGRMIPLMPPLFTYLTPPYTSPINVLRHFLFLLCFYSLWFELGYSYPFLWKISIRLLQLSAGWVAFGVLEYIKEAKLEDREDYLIFKRIVVTVQTLRLIFAVLGCWISVLLELPMAFTVLYFICAIASIVVDTKTFYARRRCFWMQYDLYINYPSHWKYA